MSKCRLVIAGAGGFGREVFGQIATSPKFLAERSINNLVFIDDGNPQKFPGAEIISSIRTFVPQQQDLVLVALGEPEHKKAVVSMLSERNVSFLSFVHDETFIGPRVELGEGSIVCYGSRLTADVTVAKFVTINIDTSLAHDVHVGQFSTVGPGSNLTGGVSLGEMVFVGASSSFVPMVTVGDGARIGMGSVVIRDISDGAKVFGNPAMPHN